MRANFLMYFYAPNFEEVDGHIGFGLCVRACVRPSVRASVRPSVRQEPCMLGF